MFLLLAMLHAGGPAGAAVPAALTLDVQEAMDRAAAAQRAVATGLAVADAEVLAAGAPFDPVVRLDGGTASSIDEGVAQFGRFFAETSSWRGGLGLQGAFATGTSVNLEFRADQTRFLYRLGEGGLEFTDAPQHRSRLALQVSQALLEGVSLRYNGRALRLARRAQTLARAEEVLREDEARIAAARAYREARRREKLEEIARQALSVANEQARVIAALVEAGRLAPVESTRAQAGVAQAELALLDAGNARGDALDALCVAMREPPGTPLLLADGAAEVRAVGLDLTPEGVATAIEEGNLELQVALYRESGAQLAVRDARHALLPTLAATGGVGLTGFEPSLEEALSELAGGQLRDWNGGLTLSLPLGNRGDRAALARAEAELARLQAERVDLEGRLAQQAAAQLRVLASATRRLDLTAVNERLARETLDAEMARLAEGRSLPREVASAAQSLTQAQGEALAALHAWLEAHDNLRRLQGRLVEPSGPAAGE